MALLALETTWDLASVCVVADGKVRSEERPGRQTIARDLVPWCERLLAELGLGPQDLGAVAVDIGPGSFTGTRIGVATAKALAQALGIPLFGIPSLDVVAWRALQAARPGGGSILAALPAHSQDHFTAAYCLEGVSRPTRTSDYHLLPAGLVVEMAAALTPPVLLAGSAGRIEALAEAGNPAWQALAPEETMPTAAGVARLAEMRRVAGQADDPLTLAPLYLRASAAEVKAEGLP